MDYCSSKFAAVGIHDALKTELRSQGHGDYIKTTVVCPYFINTGMFDGVTAKVSETFQQIWKPRDLNNWGSGLAQNYSARLRAQTLLHLSLTQELFLRNMTQELKLTVPFGICF